MKRFMSNMLSLFLACLGFALIAGGLMGFKLGTDQHRAIITYGFLVGNWCMLACAVLFPFAADTEYRKIKRRLLLLLSLLCILYFIYFGVMWTLLGETGMKISVTVLFILLGIAVLFVTIVDYFMGKEAYRPMATEFLSQLPYAYYRYRT
ncbi:MAG: hypothetical protein JXA49_08255 [Actinobacteria bacterium]|nr:hypothetical protein [Actinomycetota bacterium]